MHEERLVVGMDFALRTRTGLRVNCLSMASLMFYSFQFILAIGHRKFPSCCIGHVSHLITINALRNLSSHLFGFGSLSFACVMTTPHHYLDPTPTPPFRGCLNAEPERRNDFILSSPLCF